jgi:hypothetical protein
MAHRFDRVEAVDQDALDVEAHLFKVIYDPDLEAYRLEN